MITEIDSPDKLYISAFIFPSRNSESSHIPQAEVKEILKKLF